jgi:ABC-type maltose transport system permease subunit
MDTITFIGYTAHVTTWLIFAALVFILFMFYRIQKQEKLDFTDMITNNGRTVSLTKVLQLIGGVTATWVMIKLTIAGNLNDSLFGLYLAYVGGIEGYSKYVAAKYSYTETSVRDAKQ